MKDSCGSNSWLFNYDHVEDFICMPNAFSSKECDDIVKIGKQYNLIKGSIDSSSDGSTKTYSDYRQCSLALVNIEDMPSVYQKLSEHINKINDKFFKFDLWGFHEPLQFTEYVSPTDTFSIHSDKISKTAVRKLTCIVQLTDEKEYDGGDLEIYLSDKPGKMPRKKGMLIVFPSYILHRVSPVTKGIRHSLVGWLTGNPFK